MVLALNAAIEIGNDTDTVAAIAGSALGTRWGLEAIPEEWRQKVHGWGDTPSYTATCDDLIALVDQIVR
jgi:ADP-ribosylglycohydrolase